MSDDRDWPYWIRQANIVLGLHCFWTEVVIFTLLEHHACLGFVPHWCGDSFALEVPCMECGAGL
jgi:hypothetical protein